MNRTARTPARPALVVLPAPGDRVCLAGWALYTDRHDHGTVVDVRQGGLGTVKALVAWDDDRGDEPTAWCDLSALDLRCSTRATNTTPSATPEAR